MTDWKTIYAPLLGKQLEGAAFLPISCDTLQLVADLSAPRHWFSGAMLLGFREMPPLSLTWRQNPACLSTCAESDWRPFALNRVAVSSEAPWDSLCDATLQRVELFSALVSVWKNEGNGITEQDWVVAARHDFAGRNSHCSLWICTGYGPQNMIGEGDDLYVALTPPENLGDLKPAALFR